MIYQFSTTRHNLFFGARSFRKSALKTLISLTLHTSVSIASYFQITSENRRLLFLCPPPQRPVINAPWFHSHRGTIRITYTQSYLLTYLHTYDAAADVPGCILPTARMSIQSCATARRRSRRLDWCSDEGAVQRPVVSEPDPEYPVRTVHQSDVHPHCTTEHTLPSSVTVCPESPRDISLFYDTNTRVRGC